MKIHWNFIEISLIHWYPFAIETELMILFFMIFDRFRTLLNSFIISSKKKNKKKNKEKNKKKNKKKGKFIENSLIHWYPFTIETELRN